MNIEKLIDSMSLDDLCGQVLTYDLSGNRWTQEQIEEIFQTTLPGGIFIYNATKEKVERLTACANRYTKAPVIISTDAENGPGGPVKGETTLPEPMSWGACCDEDLIEKAGIVTAEICRQYGLHWSFAPIIDLHHNPKNPGTNIRGISESPTHTAKIAKAYARGLQRNGLMAAGCKHFPGDSVDDRNSHFCTLVNSLPMDQWMETQGYAYKEMFAQGIQSVMVGHTSLPAWQQGKEGEYEEYLGYKPATLSKALMTDLLKGELGFEGCIVSDAMSMVGACAIMEPDDMAVEYLKCGGDMILFALPQDFYNIKKAVQTGKLPLERLKDAVRRILRMKQFVRLFEDQQQVLGSIEGKYAIGDIATEIAEKSITLVRNAKDVFPLNLKKGDRILIANLQGNEREATRSGTCLLTTLEEDLRSRGFEVVSYVNPDYRTVERELEKGCGCVLINCKLSCRDYKGGSIRANWEHFDVFWRGKVLRHPQMVFTSFGDPYKLYEYPYVYTYVNAYSTQPSVQRAFVRALLGEIPFSGKSPVSLPGFFGRAVD